MSLTPDQLRALPRRRREAPGQTAVDAEVVAAVHDRVPSPTSHGTAANVVGHPAPLIGCQRSGGASNAARRQGDR